MVYRLWKIVVFTLMGGFGCAGPSTPFGAVDTIIPVTQVIVQPPKENLKLKLVPNQYFQEAKAAEISLSPDRQVLHDDMDLTVAISDHQGIRKQSKLMVTFNGQKVKTISDIFVPPDDSRKGYFTFKNVRLRDDRENQILTSYLRTKKDKPISMELLPPDCSLQQSLNVTQVGDFKAIPQLLKSIQNHAKTNNLNPSLMTGVIAQESAFDSNAISWAKAIGLTQVTPIGDQQIQREFPDWPRSEKISQYPAGVLKYMIQTGQLTAKDDWRLDPEKSIIGGLALMNYMKSYWLRDEAVQVLNQYLPEKRHDLTTLTLASYHSGPLRVRRAITENGKRFLKNEELYEANRYVRRVKSYCYHFSKGNRQ